MTIHSSFCPHHASSIERVVEHFRQDPDVLALLLTGSLAHGFARSNSDVDLAIVVSAGEYQRRKVAGELTFYNADLCHYEGGYVDGKYVDIQIIRDVAARGSEAARFAFQDAQVLLSRVDGLAQLLAIATRYPVERKTENLARFMAQFEAWNWYVQQALQTEDRYLLRHASIKLALFGCRLILSHNELLFPYHKWLTRVVQSASAKPTDFERLLEELLAAPTGASTSAFYIEVKNFTDWPTTQGPWSMQFIIDSELNWLSGQTPVDDL